MIDARHLRPHEYVRADDTTDLCGGFFEEATIEIPGASLDVICEWVLVREADGPLAYLDSITFGDENDAIRLLVDTSTGKVVAETGKLSPYWGFRAIGSPTDAGMLGRMIWRAAMAQEPAPEQCDEHATDVAA